MSTLINPNPIVYNTAVGRKAVDVNDVDIATREKIDALEVYDLVRDITDPEHPLSLEQLKVVSMDYIEIDDEASRIKIAFAPTVPGCNMATLIGLCLRVKLLRSLPARFKVDITVVPGTHQSEVAVNRQLNDKERVAAALENPNLSDVVNRCLISSIE